MESTTFIKLIQQQGLNMNLEAAVNCKALFFRHLQAAPLTPRPKGQTPTAPVHFGFLVWPWEEVRMTCPLRLFTPGTPKPGEGFFFFFASRSGSRLPLFVSNMLASPGAFYRPPDGAKRAPGHRLRINESSNYIHLLPGMVPCHDPHISEFSRLHRVPLENRANYKKIIPKDKWKRPQKKITKNCHLATPGSGPCTPLQKPASPSPVT